MEPVAVGPVTSLFPFRTETEADAEEPKLVDFDTEEADEVFDALGSKTARTILMALHDEPRPASELTDVVDTSVQNVQYHLTKLEAADLVDVVDTWYSDSGSEMSVYAPADRALVLFAGDDRERSLGRLLERIAGAVGALALGAVVLTVVLTVVLGSDEAPPGTSVNATAPIDGTGADPLLAGLVFLLGGLTVLGVLVLVETVVRS